MSPRISGLFGYHQNVEVSTQCIYENVVDPRVVVEKRAAAQYYDDIVKDGGRPLFPIDRFEDVCRNRQEYIRELQVWDHSACIWNVNYSKLFLNQLKRWEEFRLWQIISRGLEDNDTNHVKKYIYRAKLNYLEDRYYASVNGLEADTSFLKTSWKNEDEFAWVPQYWGEERSSGLSEHEQKVKQHLARHDFTKPFQLDKDPNQQDKLTTWIEYLSFEYMRFDWYTQRFKEQELAHKTAWCNYVDEEMSKPCDTEEFRQHREDLTVRTNQLNEAEKHVEEAKSEVDRLTQENAPSSELKTATNKWKVAKGRHEWFKHRDCEATGFHFDRREGNDAFKRAVRCRKVAEWVMDQVPLVEAEMLLSKAVDTGFMKVDSKDEERGLTMQQIRNGFMKGEKESGLTYFEAREQRIEENEIERDGGPRRLPPNRMMLIMHGFPGAYNFTWEELGIEPETGSLLLMAQVIGGGGAGGKAGGLFSSST
ncbi:hypothetical protein G7Z17_g5782 [Cylindrodendrum hubeiense]|uniref:Uncharacterized protein n=1 Tax=Cylindrodendrum hubeiense TaxID=595255 RepID=A0A9P5LBF8_9HYPO|nr:hypothetical protein G7Z17_g5782 [Cylindrodendrum hubeiense]